RAVRLLRGRPQARDQLCRGLEPLPPDRTGRVNTSVIVAARTRWERVALARSVWERGTEVSAVDRPEPSRCSRAVVVLRVGLGGARSACLSFHRVPIVQRPRTWPFQGQNTGSNPVGDATSVTTAVAPRTSPPNTADSPICPSKRTARK